MTLVSPIYARGPATNPTCDRDRNHAARRELWHELRVAVIDPEDVTDDWTRQAIINEAIKQYGRPEGGSSS